MFDTALTPAQVEDRLKKVAWLSINRTGLAEVAEDLNAAAAHIERVGWTQHKNFVDYENATTSPCCAVGALHAVNMLRTTGETVGRVSNAVWTFDTLYRGTLVGLNDVGATEAREVTEAMRAVASSITAYLESGRV